MMLVQSLEARLILLELKRIGVTHVINVPDSTQKELLSVAERDGDIKLITATTEDQAVGISCGLVIGGARPVVSIQNSGFFACLNALRTLTLDMGIGTFFLVGLYRRETDKLMVEHTSRAIKKLIPLMSLMETKIFHITGKSDVQNLGLHYTYNKAMNESRSIAAILGAPLT